MSTTIGNPDDAESSLVEIPLGVESIEDIVSFLVGVLVHLGQLRAEFAGQICGSVVRRESLGSTAIGRGVAIPHAQTELVEDAVTVIGRCIQSVTWEGSQDGQPVSVVCLMLSPASPSARARALESVARQLRAIKPD